MLTCSKKRPPEVFVMRNHGKSKPKFMTGIGCKRHRGPKNQNRLCIYVCMYAWVLIIPITAIFQSLQHQVFICLHYMQTKVIWERFWVKHKTCPRALIFSKASNSRWGVDARLQISPLRSWIWWLLNFTSKIIHAGSFSFTSSQDFNEQKIQFGQLISF